MSRKLFIDEIGLCEHCNYLLEIGALEEVVSEPVICPSCGRALTEKTAGFEKTGNRYKRIKWVGKNQRWVEKKPKNNFFLGNWFIVVKPNQI